MTRHAVVVDDDEAFLRFMTYSLAKGEFKVTPLSNGYELFNILEERDPDLILLDRLLPDIDGFELCEKVKKHNHNIPVIMFSTAGDATDVISGLRIGADDYLPKPFSVDMLLAKVEAVCRRYEPLSKQKNEAPKKTIMLGALSIDEGTHEVSLDGVPLVLTKTEYNLLHLLAQRPGMVVTRKEIMKKILGYQGDVDAMENNVAFHVNALRKKLGEYRNYIQTVRGFGYRFRKMDS